MLDDLNDFIHSNPDARELKRAVAVQMFLKGYKKQVGTFKDTVVNWQLRLN